MNKKVIYVGILIMILITLNVFTLYQGNIIGDNATLTYKLTGEIEDYYQVFYANDEEWTEEDSSTYHNTKLHKAVKVDYSIPDDIKKLRFDLGGAAVGVYIEDIKLTKGGISIPLDLNKFMDETKQNQIAKVTNKDNVLEVVSNGADPYIIYELSDELLTLNKKVALINNALKIAVCLIIDIIGLVIWKKSNKIISLIKELSRSRSLIWNLAKNDFKTKYAGSYLGIIWAFIQPIVTIIVYWFVFEFGLRATSPIGNVPYIVWFSAGLIPWFFYQDAIINGTNCMMEYSYLVKKVLFKISILPLVKIISALFVHVVFIIFLFIVASVYGLTPSIYSLQLIYYILCSFCLTLAISYATSAMIVFFKDLGQLISILLQVGMWMTPIMWSYTIVPEKFKWIVFINPMCYIVEGYRDTFINHVWFFDKYLLMLYFWGVVFILFGASAIIFKKLKPHFADVL